jgi:hypothetical protein
MFSILCTSCHISLGDKMKKEEIGVAWNPHEIEERLLRSFDRNTWRKGTTWKTYELMGEETYYWNSGRMCTAFAWLRTGTIKNIVVP